MIRAILAGTKTQTRRILKPQIVCESHADWPDKPDTAPSIDAHGVHCGVCGAGMKLNYRDPSGVSGIPIRFAKGDILWVRERWSGEHWLSDVRPAERYGVSNPDRIVSLDPLTWYWADGNPDQGDWERPRPGIHMPRWASRLSLVVTDVRVERLQDISEKDAIAEGVEAVESDRDEHDWSICPKCGGTGLHGALGDGLGYMEVDCQECDTHKKRYSHLWDHINGDGAWESNPFVVAVSFTVHKCNVDAFARSEAA